MMAKSSFVIVALTLLSLLVVSTVADGINLHGVGLGHRHGMARRAKDSKKWNNEGGDKNDGNNGGNNGNDQKSDHYLIVETNEGRVRGLYNSTSETYSWRGVPYGDDTSGSNRYMPPKPAGKWYDVRDASKLPSICPQHGSGESRAAIALFGLSDDIFKEERQSEDCLNVNVYVGKKQWERFRDSNGKHKKLPVWLNIYGGSFEWGSNTIETYQPHKMVHDNDILVVGINFRNWILGFPQAPQLHPWHNNNSKEYKGANPGVLDIDLAIEWAYKNVEKFGGDPERITIGGTSTGGCLADNWAYRHYNKESSKYVRGIILQSGAMTSLGKYFVSKPGDDFTDKKSVWNTVANYLGCGSRGTQDQFKCMQHKRWQDVIGATFATNSSFLLTNDNITAFVDYPHRLVNKMFTKTPMLLGNTKDEGNAWLIHNAPLLQSVGPAITAEVWVCPSSVQAKHRVGYAPTWRYRFSPKFYIPDTPKKYRALLTYHGSDTPYGWQTWQNLRYIQTESEKDDPYPLYTPPGVTDDFDVRSAVADTYTGAFVSFVTDPDNGLYNFESGWPQYSTKGRTVGDFGYQNSGDFRLAKPSEIDGLCPLTDAEIKENSDKWRDTALRFRSHLF